MKRIVLILGSAPNAVEARDWPRTPFTDIVAINNAWRVRSDWDVLIHPEDFSADRMPLDVTGKIVTAEDYVPIQNQFGGFVYAGGTMAFTAAYWALGALKPDVMAFLGCDMVYAQSGDTHFYGKGDPDPLRQDISLRSLEAKSARLMLLAAQEGCACVNLSARESRLIFPRAAQSELENVQPASLDNAALSSLAEREEALNYLVPSGKYWLEDTRFDPAEVDALDAAWLKAARSHETA